VTISFVVKKAKLGTISYESSCTMMVITPTKTEKISLSDYFRSIKTKFRAWKHEF